MAFRPDTQRDGHKRLRLSLQKEIGMKVHEAMTANVRIARPDQTIRDAAQAMAEIDAGVLPVGDNDRLVGMITDRDIAVRAVAAGKSPDTLVRDAMTSDLCYCFDDQDIDDIAQDMQANQVRRLPVVNRDKRLVGILSLADMARADGHAGATTEALQGICEPGGAHSQSAGNGGYVRELR
jgi:CBS domain-containing protein